MKHSLFRQITGTLLLFVLLLETIVLCAEALTPGTESAAQSGAVGDVIDGIITDVTGNDGIYDVPPESVAVLCGGEQAEKIAVPVGGQVALSARFFPDETSENHRKLVWNAADPEIAEVRNGILYANGVGQTTLTLSLESDPAVSVSVPVTVGEIYAEEFSLAFEGGETSIALPEGMTAALVPVFSPYDVTADAVEFSSSDESVATVDRGGIVRAVSAGEAIVTAAYRSLTPRGEAYAELFAEASVRVVPNASPIVPPETLGVDFHDFSLENGVCVGYTGMEGRFSASIAPENCSDRLLVWESSDEDVLEIGQDGSYRLKGKGVATLTVYSAFAPEVAVSSTVEVRNRSLDFTADVDGAILSPAGENAMSVPAGSSVRIAISSPLRDLYIKYETSDPACADISDEGTLLTYRASEEVVLTVTVADNAGFRGEGGDLCSFITVRLTVTRQQFSDKMENWGLFVRKIFGHFGAFTVLGMLAGSVACCFDKKSGKRRLLVLAALILFGFAFAGLTEILQLPLFTVGRGAAFSDVLIDFSGYLPGMLAVYGVYLIAVSITERVKSRRKRARNE